MDDTLFISRFTPSRTDPELLERIFVQRGELVTDAEQRITDGATGGSKPQLLFIGPRGCGKTHLVTLIFHRLNRKQELADRLRIAWLSEDETTTSFVKLLLRIHRALQSRYPKEFTEADTQAMRQLDESGRAQLLIRTIGEQLKDRCLLVVVENLDDVFKGLQAQGQKQWRALLQEHPIISTLATSQQLFAGVSRREQPFFGFFHLEQLQPLSVKDAVQLLQRIAVEKKDEQLARFLETRGGRNRVSAIHHLSGGNHRIYIVLSDFITRETLDELVGPFEKMLDEMTPYYQARLAHLPAQQREIVEFLAKSLHAVAVKDIAANLMLPHTTVTAQLKNLKELGYVRSDAVGREMRYELTEPLLRLCVEVKENNRGPMRLFVDFLRLWYSRRELDKRLKTLPSHALIEKDYILRALGAMGEKEGMDRLPSRKHRGERQQMAEAMLREGVLLGDTGKPQEAIAVFDAVIKRFGEDQEAALREQVARAMFNKGWTLGDTGKPQEAIAVYDALIERFEKDQDAALREQVAYAFNALACTFAEFGRHTEALAAIERALASDAGSSRFQHTRAEVLLGAQRWDEGYAQLSKALGGHPASETADLADFGLMIRSILAFTHDRGLWRQRIGRLVEICHDAAALPHLGSELVRSLRGIPSQNLSKVSLLAWRDVWHELADRFEEMRLPLRLLDVGIRYYETDRPEVVLDLISEERSILIDALGLDQNTIVQAGKGG